MTTQDFDSMNLGDLFAAADAVGEKYQDESYVQEYKARIADLNKEIAEYAPKGTIAAAIAAYGEPEVMGIGDQTEVDLMAHNMPIPNAGRGRIGDLVAMME